MRTLRLVRAGLATLALTSCGPPPDADAIVISAEAPAGWSSVDTIHLRGQRWYWTATRGAVAHDAGVDLPVGRPVRLVIESVDVEHRLQFPTLGLDVVVAPDRSAELWVTMRREGAWDARCVQNCPPEFPEAIMLRLTALPPEIAERSWIPHDHTHDSTTQSRADFGHRIFDRKGCTACHHLDDPGQGPPLRDFWGSTAVAADGRTVVVDGAAGEALIRDALFEPTAFVVQGYPPTMPDYSNTLDDSQATALIQYLKCLSEPQHPDCLGAPATITAR